MRYEIISAIKEIYTFFGATPLGHLYLAPSRRTTWGDERNGDDFSRLYLPADAHFLAFLPASRIPQRYQLSRRPSHFCYVLIFRFFHAYLSDTLLNVFAASSHCYPALLRCGILNVRYISSSFVSDYEIFYLIHIWLV